MVNLEFCHAPGERPAGQAGEPQHAGVAAQLRIALRGKVRPRSSLSLGLPERRDAARPGRMLWQRPLATLLNADATARLERGESAEVVCDLTALPRHSGTDSLLPHVRKTRRLEVNSEISAPAAADGSEPYDGTSPWWRRQPFQD